MDKVSQRDFFIEYNKSTSIQVSSVIDAGKNYNFPNESFYGVSIDTPVDILERSGELDARDLLLTCIEIFDWGDVQKSNILSAFKLYRDGELETYLREVKAWFEDDTSLNEPKFDVIWSSGWTKVYSFLFAYVTIYDSRVAAFINQVLKELWLDSTEPVRKELKGIANGLLTFGGNETSSGTFRLRVLDQAMIKNFGLYKQPSDKKKMLANKKASWLIRYFSELTFGNESQLNFRVLDKSAFMLGFDLKQW